MKLRDFFAALSLFGGPLFQTSTSQLIVDRSVQCLSNEMRVAFDFAQPFSGVVYATDYYQRFGDCRKSRKPVGFYRAECRWEGNGSRQLIAPVPLSTNPASSAYCGTKLRTDTGEFTVTLIISPMRGLLVDGMEGLTVRCLYNVGDVTLTLPAGVNGAGIFISPQTQAGVVTGSGGSPFLQMAIRDGHGINGEVIQSAQVGQRITLDIVMQDTTIYDFWVHDCYAHDGTNTPEASISIIDSNGCAVRLARAVDPPVFTTNPVPNGAKHVYVHMYGFQFTTSQLVYFECQVRPCLQTCNRPQCSVQQNAITALRRKRQIHSPSQGNRILTDDEFAATPENYNLTAILRIEPQQLEAVIPAASRDSPFAYAKASTEGDICLHTHVAIAILLIFILVCLISLAIAVYLCLRARKYSPKMSAFSAAGAASRDFGTSSVAYYSSASAASSPSRASQHSASYNTGPTPPQAHAHSSSAPGRLPRLNVQQPPTSSTSVNFRRL